MENSSFKYDKQLFKCTELINKKEKELSELIINEILRIREQYDEEFFYLDLDNVSDSIGMHIKKRMETTDISVKCSKGVLTVRLKKEVEVELEEIKEKYITNVDEEIRKIEETVLTPDPV